MVSVEQNSQLKKTIDDSTNFESENKVVADAKHLSAGDNQTISKRDRLQFLTRTSDMLLFLAQERAFSMRNTANCEQSDFDRGARAMSALMRASALMETLREKTVREIESDDEKARRRQSGTPEDASDIERIRLDGLRRLHAHAPAGDHQKMAIGDEE